MSKHGRHRRTRVTVIKGDAPLSVTKTETPERKRSVQTESPVPLTSAAGVLSQGWSVWNFLGSMDECPPYWSRRRDQWLREFVYRPGNDLLAGVMATAVNKCVSTGFVLEGPERTVNLFRDILLQRSEFGAGWAKMVGKDAFDFFSQDQGAFRERIRTANNDTKGAAMGFAHFDSQRMYLRGQTQFPVDYVDITGITHRLHYSQVQRYTDLPSPKEELYGVGFSAVSRAITTAHILVDIARYKRERLSDLPPAGILLLNNLEKTKWEDMEKQYNADERNKGNSTWRNVMVAFGMDPAIPATAELFEFSRLPEHFNEPEAVKIAVLSLALAFNMDVEEIWSILGGQMGSAKEADVQHLKAKAKGPGAFLTETERGWNDGLCLPGNITFKYDFQDVEEDQTAALVQDTKVNTIRKLWEPTAATGQGIITTDEARQWLQLEGIVSDELMTRGGMGTTEATADDTQMAKSFIRVDDSPRCKAFSDGRMVRLERRAQAWGGAALARPFFSVAKFNPNHAPAGSPEGGQFTSLYHGTTQSFEEFDIEKVGQRDYGNLGYGIYMSYSQDLANRYALENQSKFGGNAQTLIVNADISNTFDFVAPGAIDRIEHATGIKFPISNKDKATSKRLAKYLTEQGYDSARLGDEIVVFDSRKLKIMREVIKSIAEVTTNYRDRLTRWVYEAMTGHMDAIDLRRAHKALIRTTAQDAYFEGMRQGGIQDPQAEATDKDYAAIKDWTTTQAGFVDGFAQAASEVQGDETKRAAVLNRLSMWVDSVTNLGNAGILSAKSDRPAIWHLGETETHCAECQALDGKRHRVSWFLGKGYLPHTPPNAQLGCDGWGKCFVSDAVTGERIGV